MGSKTKTMLLATTVAVWASVYLASIVEHFQVPSQFDTAFTTIVGGILVTAKKKDDPKE